MTSERTRKQKVCDPMGRSQGVVLLQGFLNHEGVEVLGDVRVACDTYHRNYSLALRTKLTLQ